MHLCEFELSIASIRSSRSVKVTQPTILKANRQTKKSNIQKCIDFPPGVRNNKFTAHLYPIKHEALRNSQVREVKLPSMLNDYNPSRCYTVRKPEAN